MPIFANMNMYVSKSCAAISDDFRNSPEMAEHNLDTYIFAFTKIGMVSPQFSEMRPSFLESFFQWGHFLLGLIRVGASPEFTTVTSTMSRLNYRTHIKHCVISTYVIDFSIVSPRMKCALTQVYHFLALTDASFHISCSHY